MKKKGKLLPLIMSTVFLCSSLGVSAEDITEVTDQDVGSAEVVVSAEVSSVFTVGIPVSATINSETGTGSYSISVKGDLDTNYQLEVTPVDGYTTENGDTTQDINFLLKDKTGNSVSKKNDIVVDISQEQTIFNANEINLTTEKIVPVTLQAKSPITAGKWKNVIKYRVSLKEKTLEAGLYNSAGVLLCDWASSGIEVESDYSEFDIEPTCYKTKTTSGYYILTNTYTDAVKVVLPSGITKIGNNVFHDCNNLTTVVIPESVTNIGDGAFGNCDNLVSVTIPANVTEIGGSAFEGCNALTTVNLSEGLTTIHNYAFQNCVALTTISIPSSVTSIRSSAFENCSSLPSISIPTGVSFIAMSTFKGCTSLSSVTIPDSVTNIEQSAFYNCTALAELVVPDSVTTIGDGAFLNVPKIIYNGSAVDTHANNWGAVTRE